MSSFRTNTHRQKVCHELQLPEVLRRRRESAVRTTRNPRIRSRTAGFVDLPSAAAPALEAPNAPRLAPLPELPTDPAHEAIALLERRLLKLAGALNSQESLLLEMRQGAGDDTGVASSFRAVQGLKSHGVQNERKRELMEQLYKSNQVLREKITSPRNMAE
ncbi:MAG: hypothetical protein ACI87O_002358 [Planctomycetota bacterium]|jgi:hypothetical protein